MWALNYRSLKDAAHEVWDIMAPRVLAENTSNHVFR